MAHKPLIFSLLLLTALHGALALAADAPRPRVALVLGGGGARGAAHIGVLEALEKRHVPVDCVVGTSMGGLISGAYAAGVSPEKMRAEMAEADWSDMFIDNPPYAEINQRRKIMSRRFIPGSETGVSGSGVAYQGGVIAGQKIKLFFNRLVSAEHGERRIEALPLPVSIIATDIGSGEKVVFRDGNLTSAMRASMSVPGLLAPFNHDGRKLVDGGLVDNLPIEEARARCQADVVIAVNVGSPLLKAEDVGSLLSVSVQMINILTAQNVTRSLATLTSNDIYIKPDLDGISATDFKKSNETADRGKQAAEALGERLSALAVSAADYAEWAERLAYVPETAPVVDAIEIAGLKIVNPAAVQRHLRSKPGKAIDGEQLDQEVMRIYGDGWYENVDYNLLSLRDRKLLKITPVEKSWGPDYLRFGLNLNSNFKQDSSYNLRAAYDKTWLNALGGELLIAGQIGNSNVLGIELYQPLEARQIYFLESVLSYTSSSVGLYENEQKQADYKKTQKAASVGFGVNIGQLGQAHLGWQKIWQDGHLQTGIASPSFPAKTQETFSGAYAALDFDQMDRLYFPTHGWSSKLSYFNAQDYDKIAAEVNLARSFGDYVFNTRLTYQASLRGQLPYYNAATLGGFNNLSGFAQDEITGDEIRFASLRAEKIIGRLPLGLRGDMRAGVSLETGKVDRPYTETNLSGWLNSASIYLGGETPFGPVYLGYGRSSSGLSSVYLSIGTP